MLFFYFFVHLFLIDVSFYREFFMKYFFISMIFFMPINSQAMRIEDKCKLIKDYAVISSVMSGWEFYAVTSKYQAHLPYWAKRVPLFGFLASNTAIQLSSYFIGGSGDSTEPIHALKDAAASSNMFNSTHFKSNMCAV